MTTRLTLAIQEHYEHLSPSERKLAALLLDRAEDLLAYSASELAAMAGVSKATAARLFRSLGYSDFNEVRLQARQERNLAPALQRPPSRAGAGGQLAQSISSHLQSEQESLARTFEWLRSDLLRSAAMTLAKAPHVWLLGLGVDRGLVQFVAPQFARVRPDVFVLDDRAGQWAESLANCAPRDALLIVQTQPRTQMADRLMAHAAASRMATVAVVDVRNVAWARRVAGLVLPCHCASGTHAFSAMAAASMLHLLVQHVAQTLGERSVQRIDMIANLRRELDE
ncbi:hypothetical protein AAV94_05435 [Lampropedia cohaerens]|uniref:HTH rpiR-type domain-containing protein n=1 Tax=Lampropedia cohaerens TaxID=1610491 RepID=A0A0U1Q0J2_9BURK|nr:MurR/RpiR family transcriptional regulator [Lampropedia cohaerens]KKW68272.1 hypothetical protein AAV94_05435 [Lampropedia cohaerens]